MRGKPDFFVGTLDHYVVLKRYHRFAIRYWLINCVNFAVIFAISCYGLLRFQESFYWYLTLFFLPLGAAGFLVCLTNLYVVWHEHLSTKTYQNWLTSWMGFK